MYLWASTLHSTICLHKFRMRVHVIIAYNTQYTDSPHRELSALFVAHTHTHTLTHQTAYNAMNYFFTLSICHITDTQHKHTNTTNHRSLYTFLGFAFACHSYNLRMLSVLYTTHTHSRHQRPNPYISLNTCLDASGCAIRYDTSIIQQHARSYLCVCVRVQCIMDIQQ